MKRELLILLAAVTLSVAMVPRLRRAVHLDNHEDLKKINSSQAAAEICMPQTPCAWSIYKSNTKIIDSTIVNTYCNCKPGTQCLSGEEDISGGFRAHHCKPPVNEDTSES